MEKCYYGISRVDQVSIKNFQKKNNNYNLMTMYENTFTLVDFITKTFSTWTINYLDN